MSERAKRNLHAVAVGHVMPRHAPFYFGLVFGVVGLVLAMLIVPKYAISLGANCLFAGYLALTFLKLPLLTASYLHEHAREEDTPGKGILLVVFVVIAASVVSLFLALNQDGGTELGEIIASIASVILGWFTVQVMGALHYAYEYYQVPDRPRSTKVEGGLDFPGDEDPDGVAFLYFSFTVGTSVATSDTKVSSNAMRRRVMVHLIFSHFYNTILLAAAVNVLLGMCQG